MTVPSSQLRHHCHRNCSANLRPAKGHGAAVTQVNTAPGFPASRKPVTPPALNRGIAESSGSLGTPLNPIKETDSLQVFNTTMQPTTTTNPDKLVPLTAAASRFGYLDAKHFRQFVAGRHGLRPVAQGSRWFVWQSELDRALAKLAKPADATTT